MVTLSLVQTTIAYSLSNCPEDLPSLSEQDSYSVEDQTLLLCYIENHILNRHAGNVYSDFKEKTSEHFENCFNQINSNNTSVAHANGLLKKCLGQMNDGHIEVRLKNSSFIRLPFQTLYTRGKYLVKSTFPRESCSSQGLIQNGDEILSINGIPLSALLEELLPYQSNSSIGARRQSALDAISYRDYHFPDNGRVEIQVRRGSETLTFQENHYVYLDSLSDFHTNELSSKGFATCQRDSANEGRGRGYYSSRSLYSSTWTGFSDNSRTKDIATFSKDQNDLPENTCYLRFENFNSNDIYLESGSAVDFWDQIESDIAQCKFEQKKLILDMRYNKGGSYEKLSKFLSALVPAHQNLPNDYRSLIVEHDFARDRNCNGEIFTDGFEGLNLDIFKDSFCQTLNVQPLWLEGYSHEIIVLTSHYCKSSCDILARTLKDLPNVTLIGTPTEGALNGVSYSLRRGLELYQPYSPALLYFDDVTVMTLARSETNQRDLYCDRNNSNCYQPIEGLAVTPDVLYEVSKEDMTQRPFAQGFRAKIEEIISQPAR